MVSKTHRLATVTVDGLLCEEQYLVTAAGILDGDLVGPRLVHGNIATGSCSVMSPTINQSTNTCKSSIGKHFTSTLYVLSNF